MVIVPIKNGKMALIDDEDADMVSRFGWTVVKDKRKHVFYAQAYIPQSGIDGRKFISLHRLVMRCPSENIDHINGNGLDCQKHNLREANTSQNAMNQRTRSDNKTGFRGVTRLNDGRNRPYRATLYVNQKRVFSQYFKTSIEAAKAYNEASHKFFGEFGRRNLIPA